MSYDTEIPIKRLPTGRPITPKEHDANWDKLDTNFKRIDDEFKIRMPDPVEATGSPYSQGGWGLPVMMWSGPSTTIPDGWTLCDGKTSNGKTPPDLRSRRPSACTRSSGAPVSPQTSLTLPRQ